MSILVAGDWRAPMHEAACHDALRTLHPGVTRFAWGPFLDAPRGAWLGLARIAGRAQNKFLAGPTIARLNRALVRQAQTERPDVVFIYRGTHLMPETLRAIKSAGPDTVLASYCNDDPFSSLANPTTWRHFIPSIPLYDVNFVYRPHNVGDYVRAGGRNVHLLRSYFIPSQNRPVALSRDDEKKYATDVVFAGHFEADGRQAQIEMVVAAGIRFRLFGPEWEDAAGRSDVLRRLGKVHAVRGEEYNKAICGARIALCFLSRLNRDTYTRRCFEIPAAGTLMLAEYSADLAGLFREGVEAEFFRDGPELLRKIEYYLAHPDRLSAVASAGRARVIRDGHDVVSRMGTAIGLLAPLVPRQGFAASVATRAGATG